MRAGAADPTLLHVLHEAEVTTVCLQHTAQHDRSLQKRSELTGACLGEPELILDFLLCP